MLKNSGPTRGRNMPNSLQYQTGDDGLARALLFVPANQMFHRRKFYREGGFETMGPRNFCR
jgi:hypothetical protein